MTDCASLNKTKKFAVFGIDSLSAEGAPTPKSVVSTSVSTSGDDGCFSLFYDELPGPDGTGFPIDVPITTKALTKLRTVHADYARLPFEFYKSAVESLPIVCVDVVCKRSVDDKFLLFYRRDKPAANIWWWPGGRMFKGETFFDTAVRKILDETGIRQTKAENDWRVKPVSVINVWNTFFVDSNWDADRLPGREGTQTVNICVFCELEHTQNSKELIYDDNRGNANWAVEAKRWVSAEEVLEHATAFDKYVYLNVVKCRKMGLL